MFRTTRFFRPTLKNGLRLSLVLLAAASFGAPAFSADDPGICCFVPNYRSKIFVPNYSQPAVPNYSQPVPNYSQPAPNYRQPMPNYRQPLPNYRRRLPYWVPSHWVTGPYGGQQWVPGHWR